MYVAQNGNQYVVAIAGTNPFSLYDWLIEDLDVQTPVNWSSQYRENIPPSQGLDPKISQGTSKGMDILLNNSQMVSRGLGLLDFLNETVHNNEDIKIIFTGHSLGGALSPAIALAALNELSTWARKKDQECKISVYPSAGPTLGNKDFSTYYDNHLGACTTRIWNEIDIVPHAWEEKMLDEIDDIYMPNISSGAIVPLMVKMAKMLADNNNYTHINNDAPGLDGQVTCDFELCPNPSNSSSTSTSTVDEKLSQVIEGVEDKIFKDPELQQLYLSK